MTDPPFTWDVGDRQNVSPELRMLEHDRMKLVNLSGADVP
jgi:hypothetical protein